MIPADEIYHILEDLKKLRQERNYTKRGFDGVNKRILSFAKDYHWHRDELLELIEQKERFFDYKIVNKEIKIMKSLLKFISKLLKKKEFVAELADVEQFKKALRFNELKLKALDGRNKECLKMKRNFEKVVKMKDGEFEKYLGEWNSAQGKVAYVDRLEMSLEKKVMVEEARKFPESVKRKSGVWKTATAYAVAAMIGFGAITADYSVKGGISFGGGVAVAGEVQDSKSTRQSFKDLGWDVYDEPNWKGVPRVVLEYRMNHDEFKYGLTNNKGKILNYMSQDELQIFKKLVDGNPNNDEIKFVFVTRNNQIVINVQSRNKSIGKDGKYLLMKKQNPTIANLFRQLSPDHK